MIAVKTDMKTCLRVRTVAGMILLLVLMFTTRKTALVNGKQLNSSV